MQLLCQMRSQFLGNGTNSHVVKLSDLFDLTPWPMGTVPASITGVDQISWIAGPTTPGVTASVAGSSIITFTFTAPLTNGACYTLSFRMLK